MNFQEVLHLPYVINLLNSLIDNLKIVNIDNKFYIKDYKENLYLIQKGLSQCHQLEKYLNSIIYFEEYKNKPIQSFINIRRNETVLMGINYELVKSLQLQYSIDKSYFDN